MSLNLKTVASDRDFRTTDLNFKNISENWDSTDNGASNFTELDDVPASYSGHGHDYVRVNNTQTGLEFVSGASTTGIANTDYIERTYQFTRDNELNALTLYGFGTTGTKTMTALPANTVAIHLAMRIDHAGNEPGIKFYRKSGDTQDSFIYVGGATSVFITNVWVPTDGNQIYISAIYNVLTTCRIMGYKVKGSNALLQTGAKTFTELTDAPGSYAAHNSQFVKVNAGATGLEFAAAGGVTQITAGNNMTISPPAGTGNVTISAADPGARTFNDLSDVPSVYTGAANKFVKVKSTADGLEFIPEDGVTKLVAGNNVVLNPANGKGEVTVSLYDSGATGVTVFKDLSDVPSSYAGYAEQYVKVKSDATGLEFISGLPQTVPTFQDIYDGEAIATHEIELNDATGYQPGQLLVKGEVHKDILNMYHFADTPWPPTAYGPGNNIMVIGQHPSGYGASIALFQLYASTIQMMDHWMSAAITLSQDGTTGLTGFTTATSLLGALNELAVKAFQDYVKQDGTTPLTGNWEAGNYSISSISGNFAHISGQSLEINTITSTSGYVSFAGNDIITTGTISGTNVTSGVDPGHTHSAYLGSLSGAVLVDGSAPLTGNWNAGNYSITATSGNFSYISGHTLYITNSGTVANLNADYIDGLHINADALFISGDVAGYIWEGDVMEQWGVTTSSASADVEITTIPYDSDTQRYCFGSFDEDFIGFIVLRGKPTA